MEKVLELYFLTADGKTARVSIENPIIPINKEAVEQAMLQIVESQVFVSDAGILTGIKEARLVETTKTEYAFA